MRRVILVLASIASCAAMAAPYKWIDENGRVVYGDRPPGSHARLLGQPAPAGGAKTGPEAAAAAGATAAGSPTGAAASGTVAGTSLPAAPAMLPAAVKQPATQYPVVLFTGDDCAPCSTARDHLVRRGIPFSERSLRSGPDVEAFRKLGFAEMTVPAFSVGREKQSGYERAAWDRLLDAAGYPKSSAMPAGWRPEPAEPLVAGTAEKGRVVERIVRQERPGFDAPPLPVVPASAPSSIRF